MPRPRPSISSIWDARITPTSELTADQVSLFTEKLINNETLKFLICREGGTEECRLHYHIYIVSNASETTVRDSLKLLSGGKGNSFFSLRPAHDGSIGYIIKLGDVRFRHNYTDTHIEEYIALSKAYKTAKETERKQRARSSKNILSEFIEQCRRDLNSPTVREAYDHLENLYDEAKLPMPTKSSLELALINLVGGFVRREYYLKHIT